MRNLKICWWTFQLSYYVKIHWSNLSFEWSFTVFDSVTDALVIWKMLAYWALQTFLILARYLEYLLVSSPISSEVFKYYRAVKFMVADIGFSLFWFSLESSNFIINHKFCQLFFLNDHFIFKTTFTTFLSLCNCSLSGILLGKNAVTWKISSAYSSTNAFFFFWDSHPNSVYTFPILTQRTFFKSLCKTQNLIKLIFLLQLANNTLTANTDWCHWLTSC